MSTKDLVIVAFDFPEKERNTELVRPNLKILEKFSDYHFYFCTSSLNIAKVAAFFRKKEYGYRRGGEYEYRLAARKSFLRSLKRNLKKGKFFCMVDYTSNVEQVLRLENKLKKNGIRQNEANKIKEEILYLQTFARAQFVLDQINDLNEPNLVYADLSLAYALHLLTGSKIIFDLPEESKQKPKELAKMREGLNFFQKACSGDLKLEKTEKDGTIRWTKDGKQNILHDKNGVRYVSGYMSFYLMNGRPQNGFCPFHLSDYKTITN